MNKIFVFTVPISLILVACGQQMGSGTQVCDVVEIKPCTGNPPVVTINTIPKKVAPAKFCVGPNGTVKFRVKPTGGAVGTVATIPKVVTNFWLIGTNDPDADGFTLTAPDAVGEYGYYVAFKDGHCIDPMIKVRDEI